MRNTEPKTDPCALLDKPAAASRIGVSLRTVDELTGRHELPFYKIGRCVRFAIRDLDEFLAARRVEARPRPAFRRRAVSNAEVETN